MDYVPHTPADVQSMMEMIGIQSIDDLFVDLPEKYRLKKLLDLPPPLSEQEVSELMKGLGSRNVIASVTLTGAVWTPSMPSGSTKRPWTVYVPGRV